MIQFGTSERDSFDSDREFRAQSATHLIQFGISECGAQSANHSINFGTSERRSQII